MTISCIYWLCLASLHKNNNNNSNNNKSFILYLEKYLQNNLFEHKQRWGKNCMYLLVQNWNSYNVYKVNSSAYSFTQTNNLEPISKA